MKINSNRIARLLKLLCLSVTGSAIASAAQYWVHVGEEKSGLPNANFASNTGAEVGDGDVSTSVVGAALVATVGGVGTLSGVVDLDNESTPSTESNVTSKWSTFGNVDASQHYFAGTGVSGVRLSAEVSAYDSAYNEAHDDC